MALAELQNKSIAFAPQIDGKVRRFKVNDVPVEQVFKLLLDRYGLYAVSDGGVIMVFTIDGFISNSVASY